MRAISKASTVQYAALPWRRSGGTLEILLITSLKTHRWIVPKGWPMAGKSPQDAAAQEAMEEAGITGNVAKAALGSFQYNKLRKNGETVSLKVDVFPMEVAHQRRMWADKNRREKQWFSIEEALARVAEPGLRRLITKFAGNGARRMPRAAAGR